MLNIVFDVWYFIVLPWEKPPKKCYTLEYHVKGPFCNPNMLSFWYKSVDVDKKKCILKISVDSEVAFVSYAHFPVS